MGLSCINKLGYKYSWTIWDGKIISLTSGDVSVNKIIFKEKATREELDSIKELNDFKDFTNISGYPVKIYFGSVKIGCQAIPNAVIKKLVKALHKE